jgi:hypothetical protein
MTRNAFKLLLVVYMYIYGAGTQITHAQTVPASEVRMTSKTAPAPLSGAYKLYVDTADGTFHCLNPSGTSCMPAGGGGGSGTVTSVGLTVPGVLFTVSGSPITGAGSFTFTLINQNANTFLAGPATGIAAAPGFRSIVAADIPTLNQSTTGNAATATALDHTPTPCTAGSYATGITATGAATGCTVEHVGTVTTFTTTTWPTWLTPAVTNPTTTPNLNVTASTIPISAGGTNATTAAAALTSLGAEATANKNAASGYAGLDAGAHTTAAEEPAHTGDVTNSAGSLAMVLPNIATAATGLKTTINAKGQATSVTTAQASDLADGTTGIGPIALASNGDINPKTLSNVRFAAAFSGADWCAKVMTASAAIGGPGTIIMDGLAGGSACASGITLPDGQVLKFSHQGFWNIGTVNITLGNDSGLVCEDAGTVIVYTGTGFLINIASVTRPVVIGCGFDLNSAAPLGIIKISSTTNVSETRAHIRRIYFEAPTRTTSQLAILIQSDNSTASPYHNEITSIQCEQMDICVRFNSLVNNQGPNGNILDGVKCNGETACIQMADGTDNILSNISCLQGGGGGASPSCLDLGNSTNGYGVGNNKIDFISEMGTGSTGVKIASGTGKTIGNGNMLITGSSNDAIQINDASGTATNTIILPTQATIGSNWTFKQQANKLGQADTVADSAAINTTETIIVKTPALAANRLVAGTHIRITLVGTCTTTAANTSTFTLRMGTLGTTSDTAIATPVTSVAGTTGTSIPFKVVLEFTVRTASATGTGFVSLQLDSQGTTGITATQTPNFILPSMSTFNTTTANNILSLSYKSAATTTTSTFKQATIQIIQN